VSTLYTIPLGAQDLPVTPYFTTYTPQDYPGEQQNRWILQQEDHSMLVANSGGLLQHGDLKWRLFGGNEITFLSALKSSKLRSNTIWAGSFSNIGYFQRSDSALFAYQSLTEKLPDSLRDFSDVSAIEEFDDRVYFLNDLYLFCYDPQTEQAGLAAEIYRAFDHSTVRISHITVWHDRLFAFLNDGTVITLDSNRQTERMNWSNGSNRFDQIVASAQWNQQLLLGDLTGGLFLLNGNQLSRFNTPVTEYVIEHQISDLAVFEDGKIAIATRDGGTVVMAQDGRFEYLLAQKTGLDEDIHNDLHIDHQQDLWIAGNQSITKVHSGVPLNHLNGSQFGFGDAVQIYQGEDAFWVGSIDGLYRFNGTRSDILHSDPQALFTEISGLAEPFWDFHEIDGQLWTARNAGVFEIQEGQLSKLFDKEAFAIRPLTETQMLIVTQNGVDWIRKEQGRWVDQGPLDVASFYMYALAVTDSTTFWAGGVQGQLVKVSFDPETQEFTERYYTDEDGLLPSDTYEPVVNHGQLVINSNSGYMVYNQQNDRLEPFTGLNADLGGWGEYLSLDKAGNYWSIYAEGDYRGVVKMEPESDSTWTRTTSVFELSPDHFGDFIEIEEQRIWVGSTESIMIRELYEPIISSPPTVSIWQVQSLFDQQVLSRGEMPQSISYEQKQIRIDLTSSSFRFPEKNRYRYRLADGPWSEWRSNPQIVFNEFFPGTFQLTVQTSDFMRQRSQPQTYTLVIQAPWYLSEFAYVMYGLLLVGGIFFAVRSLSSYRIQREMEQIKVREAEKLIELDEMKNRLFANISHEFRTPLTISHGLVKKLIRQRKNGEEATASARDLQVMNRNLNRLRDMVNQIIDLTKADKDHLKLNQNYYRGDQLVSISTESFRSLAEYHGHRYQVVQELEDVILFVDRSKVEIIMNNLISNAIKYTGDGGQILIKAYTTDDSFQLLVSDNGPGIPEGDEEAIFERFYRIQKDEDEYVEGMGVGLELSRTLARMHGGDITLLSNRDQGAGFLLTLPIPNHDRAHQVLHIDEAEMATVARDVLQEKAGTPSAAAAPRTDTRKVLLVEDNQDMSAYVAEILAETAQVQTAANGREALDYLEKSAPDLIITDLMMPQMDGATLIQTLSEHKRWKEIPVIVLTAKAIPEHKTELLRIGVVDYITKPFEPDQLMLKVRNLLTYAHRRLEIPEPEEDEVSQVESFKEQVIQYIREHLSDPNLTVDQVVESFPKSRRSFYRNIQRTTGMTPSELIREVRFKTAQRMVQSGQDYTLEELADAVGYKSATSFRRAFEKSYGKHPLDR
jgi:signal transduction histidine kinase/DNA-binding response OmpR family regulator